MNSRPSTTCASLSITRPMSDPPWYPSPDHALLAERGDVAGRIAETAQHRVGVLAEHGQCRPGRGRHLGELDRRADEAASPGRRLDVDDHAAVAQLRIVVRLLDVQDRPEADLLAIELGHPLRERLLAKGGTEEAEHLLPARLAELLRNELLAAEVVAERGPEVRLVGADGDEARVAGLVHGVARPVSRELLLAPLWQHAAGPVDDLVADVPGGGTVEHRDVDQLAASGLLPRNEGGEDPHRGHQRPRAEVRDLHRRDHRRPVGRAGVLEHARVAQVVDVVPDLVAVRSVLAVARDGAVDEAWV